MVQAPAAAAGVRSTLSALPTDGQGLLVAAAANAGSSCVVLGTVPVADGSSFAEAAAAVSALLPLGLYVVGSYSSTGNSSSWQPSKLPAGTPTITASSTGPGAPPTWTVNGQQQTGGLPAAAAAAAAAAAGGAAEDVLQVAAGFVPVRAHVEVQLQVTFPAPPPTSSSNAANGTPAAGSKQQQPVPPAAAVQAAVQQLQAQLFSNLQQLVFVPDQAGSAASNSSNSSAKQQSQPQKLSLITPNSPGSLSDVVAGSSSSSSSGDPCVTLKLLQDTSSSSGGGATPPPAPMFIFMPANRQQQQQLLVLPLSLDVLCYAPSSSSLSELHRSLLQVSAGRPLAPVRALHFQPPVLGFPVTVCYLVPAGPQETAEDLLLPHRQELHSLLGLPPNVPMLRFANALAWGMGEGEPEAAVKSVRLRNVHEALTPPGFGGRVYLVDGLYEYYHYMQDKFNDGGWGCAYRSLQTIISWFRLQHYTAKPVPGHRQIQEILVSTGDKDASLIGSSQWLGSFELSYILDAYLGITCKMVTVNQGADIPSRARELAQHFESQGTPVMIGGGVLAYTLLGVAFNEDTGEAAFLILDPHYTGGEDLKKIVAGSWVAWKQLGDNAAAGGPLFVKDAFYNFMCPQRPKTV